MKNKQQTTSPSVACISTTGTLQPNSERQTKKVANKLPTAGSTILPHRGISWRQVFALIWHLVVFYFINAADKLNGRAHLPRSRLKGRKDPQTDPNAKWDSVRIITKAFSASGWWGRGLSCTIRYQKRSYELHLVLSSQWEVPVRRCKISPLVLGRCRPAGRCHKR